MTTLTGPSSAPANGAKPTSLVILLHGYGSNGDDLIGLAPYWRQALPETLFVSPNAPQPVPGSVGGYQWWPLTSLAPPARAAGVRVSAGLLNTFIDEQLAATGLSEDKLALVGFSQGTMMSLHTGLRRPVPPAAIVGYSGMFIMPNDGPPETVEGEIASRPPVLLVHGDRDELIPVQALFHASSALSALEVPVEWHISQGIGHGIDQEGLRHGGEFLARRFGM